MRAVLVIVALILLMNIASATEFHLSIVGDGKLHPGDDRYITILIENEGEVTNFPLNENTSQLLPLITMAKDLRVEIQQSLIPIKVETVNPQLIGDLPAGRVARATFRIKVDENAKLGEYRIPVKLEYTKVSYTITPSGIVISYIRDQCDIEYVKIEITKKDYDFSVVSLKSSLKTGQEGVVSVEIKNTGSNKIYNATLYINTTPPLIPNPKAMSAYLGDIGVNKEVKASFKVYVMSGALNQSYPAKLILRFKTSAGIPAVLYKTIGVRVVNNDLFKIVEIRSFLTPSKVIPMHYPQQTSYPMLNPMHYPLQTSYQMLKPKIQSSQLTTIPSIGFVSVKIKNLGGDLRDAIAILGFDTPLLQAENMPYLGYFKKGETKEALFYVKSLAPPGRYRGYVMLKYKNELGDEEISQKEFIEVNVDSITGLRIEKVETENVGVGLRGSLNILIKNCMNSSVSNAEFGIVSPDPSIIPLSSASFLTELKPKEAKEIRFRISVSDEAISGTYNLYLIERFSLGNAKDLVSVTNFPIVVQPKMAYFEVLSIKSDLHPDETGDVIVKIKNAGNLTIHNGIVELDVSTPLTIAGVSSLSSIIGKPQPGLYFIGTLKPQEVATAKFKVDVSKDAGAGYYPVTIRIKYYDNEGYVHLSNPITLSVEVKEKPLITGVMAIAIILASVAVVAAAKFARKRKGHE